MKIDNWPMDRIMRLPDWCFGRRWFVGDFIDHAAGGDSYLMGEEELPDFFVIWGVQISCFSANCLQAIRLTLRIGDHLPVNFVDVRTMEILLKGVGNVREDHELYLQQNGLTWIHCERLLIESAGRRLVYAASGDAAIRFNISIGVLISAMPKEVPDWLISASGKNLI